MTYDVPRAMGDDIIWATTVDRGKFVAKVTRTGSHKASFRVTVAETGEVLIDEEVGLSYGAMFGPDVDDVAGWSGAALGAIDGWLDRQR